MRTVKKVDFQDNFDDLDFGTSTKGKVEKLDLKKIKINKPEKSPKKDLLMSNLFKK